MLHTDGKIYGLTSNGGANDLGVSYGLDLGLKPFVKLTSTVGVVGNSVGILGQGFTGATVVKFNGAAGLAVSFPYAKKRNHHPTGSSGDGNRNEPKVDDLHAKPADQFEGLHMARPYIVKFFGRIERICEKVDQAFAGQPFWPDIPPDAPANRRRFKAFIELHEQGVKLLSQALDMWMFSYGFVLRRRPDPSDRQGSKRKRPATGPSEES
jgi:hypothetical protein